MSYEGYVVYLCEVGHVSKADAYDKIDACRYCRARLKWSAEVDETNGYDEELWITQDPQMRKIGEEDVWHVDHYGNEYATKRLLYEPVQAPVPDRWRLLEE